MPLTIVDNKLCRGLKRSNSRPQLTHKKVQKEAGFAFSGTVRVKLISRNMTDSEPDIKIITLKAQFDANVDKLVYLEGIYQTRAIAMARFRWSAQKAEEEDKKSHIAVVVLKDKTEIQLGVYFRPDGARPLEERETMRGKRVRVRGIAHSRTPTQMSNGIPMATMTGPYVQVESIELIE